MIKIPANTKKAAIKQFKNLINRVGENPLHYGHPYKKVMAYCDGYMIWTTNIDLEIPKAQQPINIPHILDNYINANAKIEINYADLKEFIKKAKLYKSKTSYWNEVFSYPIKTKKYTVWIDSKKLKLIIELTENNMIRTMGNKQPIFIIPKEDTDENKALLTPIKVNETFANKLYNQIINYEVNNAFAS